MNTFKRARGLVSGFVALFTPEIKDTSIGIFKYGVDNLLPNRLLKYISDSGVARRAVSKVSEYIASDGFVDRTLADKKVNPKQTADKLLAEIANYAAFFNGFALHISRNAKGEIASVKNIPFQCVRQKTDLNFVEVNLTYGQPKYDKGQSKTYPKYFGEVLPVNLLTKDTYKDGEVLYVFKETADNAYYPVPDYYAQIEDIRTSAEISKMDLELALNGFMPSMMITVVGDVDDVNKDDSGMTELDYVHEDFKQFTGQVKNSEGLSGRFKAMLNFAKTKEEVPVLQTLDIKSILDSSNAKRDVIDRAVCRLFGVHPVLLGYSDASVLGNTQSMANASLELNRVVNSAQRMITEAFEKLYPLGDWTISEYTPITYVDPALFQDMTQDERRNKFLGLEPIETAAPVESEKTIKALSSLSPLVANKVLESLSKDEIRALVGLAPDNTQTLPNATVN